ncbi:hypothetical protein [Streptomyces sp. NBC_00620]|uniref:hypothetical protein n=1 Tax=unclassified Streptomyces TaxID=2593676 RepID=UPI002251334F|nr:hypothetical protein [Streptomyces sp. NBC_00620]MCX4972843.1 hypothetical protein [Streptomyces sp. NBC_00620]WUC12703.1 hypothetical protein OG256_23765 [Streptomyces sp. NBC_00564]
MNHQSRPHGIPEITAGITPISSVPHPASIYRRPNPTDSVQHFHRPVLAILCAAHLLREFLDTRHIKEGSA